MMTNQISQQSLDASAIERMRSTDRWLQKGVLHFIFVYGVFLTGFSLIGLGILLNVDSFYSDFRYLMRGPIPQTSLQVKNGRLITIKQSKQQAWIYHMIHVGKHSFKKFLKIAVPCLTGGAVIGLKIWLFIFHKHEENKEKLKAILENQSITLS